MARAYVSCLDQKLGMGGSSFIRGGGVRGLLQGPPLGIGLRSGEDGLRRGVLGWPGFELALCGVGGVRARVGVAGLLSREEGVPSTRLWPRLEGTGAFSADLRRDMVRGGLGVSSDLRPEPGVTRGEASKQRSVPGRDRFSS